MAKRPSGRPSRGPQRRHVRTAPDLRPPHSDRAEDQELFRDLRRGLRSDEPLDLLSMVSSLVEATDPRSREPFDTGGPEVSLGMLVESFIGTPYAETTAALACLQALTTDEVMAARIGRELAARPHPMPHWLAALDESRADHESWFLTDVLGDGDDYFFAIRLPGGHHLSVLVYVDHNLGGVVKDSFVVPEPLSDFMPKVRSSFADPDQTLTRVDPAYARAVVEDAIERGSHFWPPLTSESWPMCRPLVEWVLRHLPEGGLAPQSKGWTDKERSRLARDFFASPYATGMDHADERDLLGELLWFGTEYGSCEPLHWSPVNVEIVLVDWFPRKVAGEPAYLAKLPDVLRAFIRYAHHQKGIRADLTLQTLDALDHWEPDYQRLIRTQRLQGSAALLGSLFEAIDDEISSGEFMLERLDRRVGGRIQLQGLDEAALPDEPFDWAGIPEDIQPVIEEMLGHCDRCADELLDVEHRTAMRRFLGRAAVGSPETFRRKASPTRGAAAVAWVICRANDTVASHRPRMSVQDLLAWFGVKGSVSQRAEALLRATGVDPGHMYGTMDLGTPDLLTARTRREIMLLRDQSLAADT